MAVVILTGVFDLLLRKSKQQIMYVFLQQYVTYPLVIEEERCVECGSFYDLNRSIPLITIYLTCYHKNSCALLHEICHIDVHRAQYMEHKGQLNMAELAILDICC